MNKLTKEECEKALEDSRYLSVAVVNESGAEEWYGDFEQTVLFDICQQLIKEHFELKERHSKILDDIHNCRSEAHTYKLNIAMLMRHFKVNSIEELKNIYLNNPYTFEDLCENEPVWDKVFKCWRYVLQKDYDKKGFHDFINNTWIYFEKNRFYPVTEVKAGKANV